MRLFLVIFAVEALAASWIEIHCVIEISKEGGVEALAASWIEIVMPGNCKYALLVEALAASWIEIVLFTANEG